MLALLLLVSPTIATATAQPSRELRDMPVMVLYCDDDPGGVHIEGGMDPAPETLIESGQCTPAEGVALTFVLVNNDWDFEEDDPEEDWDVDADSWFARCDMDADGLCQLNSPVGFDIVLGVFLHDATVKPGYEPVGFRTTTHNFTEFSGYGLALIPTADTADAAGDVADHQTLALNITEDDSPANILTEWDIEGIDDDLDTYLATNADGWVSAVTAPKQKIEIDLVNVHDMAMVNAVCSANDDASVTVQVSVGIDGDLTITVPDTASDIRCDVEIMAH
jgi:hypothetical protein